MRGFKLRAPQIVQGGTLIPAIYAQALAARSMSRPSPAIGSLTRGNGRGVADFWPGAYGGSQAAEYIRKRGDFWGVRHRRGQRTHRPRRSPPRMRGWGGVWLGRQVCHWGTQKQPAVECRRESLAREKVQSSGVTLKPCLHDLRAWRRH